MKLKVFCTQCHFETPAKQTEILAEMHGENIFTFECKHGHKEKVYLLNERFELLFEFGAMAHQAGFFREAVSSYSVSIERFFEFFVKVILTSKKIGEEEIDYTWKQMEKQSERQLGAFLTTYLEEFNKSFTQIDQKMVSFRNNVTHKGYMPSQTETTAFAKYSLKLIYTALNELHSKHAKTIKRLEPQILRQKREMKNKPLLTPDGFKVTTLFVHPIVSVNKAPMAKDILSEKFELLLERHAFIQKALYTS